MSTPSAQQTLIPLTNEADWTSWVIQQDGWYRLITSLKCVVVIHSRSSQPRVFWNDPDVDLTAVDVVGTAEGVGVDIDAGSSTPQKLAAPSALYPYVDFRAVIGDTVFAQQLNNGAAPTHHAFLFLGQERPITGLTYHPAQAFVT